MNIGTNVVKITAKTALRGKWVKAVVAAMVLIFTGLTGSIAAGLTVEIIGSFAANAIFFVYSVLLTMPVALGVLRYIWRMLFSADDNPVYVFYWFSNRKLYARALKLIIVIGLRFIFWLVILNIPALLLNIFSSSAVFESLGLPIPLWTANIYNMVLFFRFAASVGTVILMLKYYIAPVLFVADDNIEVEEAMHMSTVISRKTSVDFIYLVFSFFGWIVLSVLMVPIIFTLPYIITSYAVHVRFAIAEYNNHIKEGMHNSSYMFYPGM